MDIMIHSLTKIVNPSNSSLGIDDNKSLKIYYGNSQAISNQVDELIHFLSVGEVNRMNRFKFNSDRDCYIAVHALLRKHLSSEYSEYHKNIEFVSENNKKPHIPGFGKDFNITHSGDLFSYTIANNKSLKTGIDIEIVKDFDNILSVADDCFSSTELDYIFNETCNWEEKLHRFYEMWTCKEAFLKMIGIGLYVDLKTISLTPGENSFKVTLPPNYYYKKNNAFLFTQRFGSFILSVSLTENLTPHFVDIFS